MEAAHTALENERLLAQAALRNAAAASAAAKPGAGGCGAGHRLPADAPALRFLSRRGCADILTFAGVDEFPSAIAAASAAARAGSGGGAAFPAAASAMQQ